MLKRGQLVYCDLLTRFYMATMLHPTCGSCSYGLPAARAVSPAASSSRSSPGPNFGGVRKHSARADCWKSGSRVLTPASTVPGGIRERWDDTSRSGGRKACADVRVRSQSGPSSATEQSTSTGAEDTSKSVGSVPGVRNTVWDQIQLAVPSNPKLDKSINADVVVVGAGIAGLSVAYNLAKAGKKVVVLESRAIGSGQTGKTTGHLMPWNDDFYSNLEKNLGKEKAKLVGESHRGAIDWIEKVVKDENIECAFKRIPGYLVPEENNEQSAIRLRQEYEAAKRAGFNDNVLERLGDDPKTGNWKMAIEWPEAGEFHPLLYIQGLAKAVKEKYGGQIFEGSAVVHQDGTTVTTSDGHTVNAGSVVLATNAPINKNLAIFGRLYTQRSYAVGLKIPRGAYDHAAWWDTATPYHRVRLVDKGDKEHEILVVGGEDTITGMLASTEYPPVYENLEKWARTHWPAAGEVVYRWSGQAVLTSDFLGVYGKDPVDFGSVYIATGDSGQGMTGGTLAGIVISSLILGSPHPWAELYNPSRLPPLTAEVAKKFGEVFIDDIEGFRSLIPFQGVDAVGPDTTALSSGAVIQEGLNKVAAYRDSSGTLHRYSAICPHLACVVKWNPIDSTFDCPCHGSQFDTQGICVNGPAKANLSPITDN